MTETLILLFMVQNNSSTNATDSVFANNNVSESGGAIYTDVRARFQYKAFDTILCSRLFKGMHAFMEIQWNMVGENPLSYEPKTISLSLLHLKNILLHSEFVSRYTLVDHLDMNALGISGCKILKLCTCISYMSLCFWIYEICLPSTRLRYNLRNGSNAQHRIKYPLHSVLFGIDFLNNIYFPISNCLTCAYNNALGSERHTYEFEYHTSCFLEVDTRFQTSALKFWNRFDYWQVCKQNCPFLMPKFQCWKQFCPDPHSPRNNSIEIRFACILPSFTAIQSETLGEIRNATVSHTLYCHKLHDNLFYGRKMAMHVTSVKNQFVRIDAHFPNPYQYCWEFHTSTMNRKNGRWTSNKTTHKFWALRTLSCFSLAFHIARCSKTYVKSVCLQFS